MKKNLKKRSVWNILTPGLDNPGQRKMFWFAWLPGVCAFRAISLGKIRKMWLVGKQHLIMYRTFENKCVVAWISDSQLIERP